MKTTACFLALFFFIAASIAQPPSTARNIFIITIDGYRWQELFGGADSAMLNDPRLVKDTSLSWSLYGDKTADRRRAKLMPFFWNVVAAKGQLFGNRSLGNRADVKNWSRISYPGYNEMLTGYPDPFFIPNIPLNNRNENVLERLNAEAAYHGKVAAFTSWNIFPYIFNEKRSNIPLNSGYRKPENFEDAGTTSLMDSVQAGVVGKKKTRFDQLTYLNAREYIGAHHPKIVFLGFGETDECAHAGRYDLYLQKANDIDRMIGDLWYFVQTDAFYRNNTTFVITTDHGRGDRPESWHTHGLFTRGSSNIWLALLGAGIDPTGELHNDGQIYQKQLAMTIAAFAGLIFGTSHNKTTAIVLPHVEDGGCENGYQPLASK